MAAPVRHALHRKEGWFAFCARDPELPPPRLSPAEFAGLPPDEQKVVVARWRRQNAALGPYSLGPAKVIGNQLNALVKANDRMPGDRIRRAAAIDGEPTLGKTTILQQFGRVSHRGKIAEHGTETEAGDEFIPVCCVTLPRDTTIKALNGQLIDFFGHTYPTKSTASDLTRRVVDVMHLCSTTLVCIDDLHYMTPRELAGRQLNDHLKHLMNEVPATFVFAGVGLEHEGIFREGRAVSEARYAQLSHRLRRCPVQRMENTTSEGGREWRSLLRSVERDVRVLGPVQLSDPEAANYMHRRTGGSIGAVVDLINLASDYALDRDLKDPLRAQGLTTPTLDAVRLSHGAEQRDTKATRPGRRRAA